MGAGVGKTRSRRREPGKFEVCLRKGGFSGRVVGTGHLCWRWGEEGPSGQIWGGEGGGRGGPGRGGRFLKCELKGQFRAVLVGLGNSFALQGPFGDVPRPLWL